MKKQSAGILLYRFQKKKTEVFLVHPGGPFWKNKDAGAWTIPKGEFTGDEDPLEAAKREFEEETGTLLTGKFTELQPIKQKAGKTVYAWAIEGDIDPSKIKSNSFEIEWPPKSGKMTSFPEIDRADWFDLIKAKEKINISQVDIISQLEKILLQ
ncbi:MAG: NUDIX domain-containing protein [Chitinophagaceae bacterium]